MLLAGGPQAGQHGGDALSPQCNWSGLSPSRGPAGASDAHDTKLRHSVAASSPAIDRDAKAAYRPPRGASHCSPRPSPHVLPRPMSHPRARTQSSPRYAPQAAPQAQPRSVLPALLVLFVGSGIAALVYEVVWFQLLELVIGSSAISLGVLLATYMGGMCAGSLLLPRLTRGRTIEPLRLYALLEAGIGVCGLLVLAVVPLVSGLYSAIAGHGAFAIVVRAVVCAICLLPPTILMGATLPAAARYAESTPNGVAWIGFLYGGNTVGAVFGSVLAGFYLLRVHDLTVATLAAVAMNIVVAGAAMILARRSHAAAPPAIAEPNLPRVRSSWPVYIAIALSGAAALGAEVVWTRLLSLMLGATTYTFSMILGVFLTGLGVGSAFGSWLGRRIARPAMALGVCQMLQLLGVMWAAVLIAKALPFWPINPSLAPSPWFTFQLDLTRTIWAVLPAALLWGASFPLALAAASERGQDPARLVSGVYAANTVGAIVGALGFSLVVVPQMGTQHAQQVLLAICAASAMLIFGWLIGARGTTDETSAEKDTAERAVVTRLRRAKTRGLPAPAAATSAVS